MKMKNIFNNIKLILSTIFLLFVVTQLNAQDEHQKHVPNVLPPPPEVASLGKYVDFPVSLYTGLPEISIPIWSIKSGNINVPISLSYHASGIKVDEIASEVGIGWSLNAGGVLGRTIRGLNDFATKGYVLSGGDSYYLPNGEYQLFTDNCRSCNAEDLDEGEICGDDNGVSYVQYVMDVMSSTQVRDTEADLYFFNGPGISGKFVFDQDGNPYLIPKSDYEILWDDKIIIDPNGTKYYFGENGYTSYSISSSEPTSVKPMQGITSWFLTKIEDIHGNFVSFDYVAASSVQKYKSYSQPYRKSTMGWPSEHSDCDGATTGDISVVTTTINHNTYLIDQITSDNGSIKFNYSSNVRLDGGSKILESIEIKNQNNTVIKEFEFETSYDSNDKYYDDCASCEPESLRLWLHEITEIDANGNSKPPYIFDYIIEDLPNRLTFGQDHWGYHNDVTTNDNLLPKLVVGSIENVPPWGWETHETCFGLGDINDGDNYFPGANRDPNENSLKEGILNKITFPTGGFREYEYEINEFQGRVGDYSQEDANVRVYNETNIAESFSDEFEITDKSRDIVLYYQINAPEGQNTNEQCVIEILKKSSNGSFYLFNDYIFTIGTGNNHEYEIINLIAGDYKLRARVDPNYGATLAEATIGWEEFVDYNSNVQGGGLRVKKIKNYPSSTESPLVKSYIYDDNHGNTTGKLMASPKYSHFIVPTNSGRYCYFLNITSSSIQSLSSTQGSFVGYSQVIEIDGNNDANGKTEYKFVNEPDVDFSKGRGHVPHTPLTTLAYRNGKLKEKKVFRKLDNPHEDNQKHYNLAYGRTLNVNSIGYIGTEYELSFYYDENLETVNLTGTNLVIDNIDYGSSNIYGLKKVIYNIHFTDAGSLEISTYENIIDDIIIKNSNGTNLDVETFETHIHNYWIVNSTYVKTYDEFFNYNPMLLINLTHNEYEIANQDFIRSMKFAGFINHSTAYWCTEGSIHVCGDPRMAYCIGVNSNSYFDLSESYRLKSSTEQTFDFNNNQWIINISNYDYTATHQNPIKITNTLSDKSIVEKNMRYPADFGSVSNNIYHQMHQRNMKAPVIEEYTTLTKSGNTNVIGGKFNVYRSKNGVPVVDNILTAELSAPVTSLNTNIDNGQPDLTYYTKEISLDAYDDNGNLLQFTTRDSISTSFIWGYNEAYPIAKAVNAAKNQIYFTSFEEEATGLSSYSKSGDYEKSIADNYFLPSSFYDHTISGDYVLTYWWKSSETSEWVFVTDDYSNYTGGNPISTSKTNGYIDELRFHPKDASMTTYTYNVPFGISSTTDANNTTTHYKYDGFGRLQFVKDMDKNILKYNKYNYGN